MAALYPPTVSLYPGAESTHSEPIPRGWVHPELSISGGVGLVFVAHCHLQAGLGIRSFALLRFRSKSLILKSDCEQFALIALYKRANCCRCSLKKNDMSDLLVIPANLSKKQVIRSKKFKYFICFWQFHCFPPFLCPRANRSHRSWLSRFLQKSYCERFAQVAHDK